MRAIYYAWRCTAEEKEDGMAHPPPLHGGRARRFPSPPGRTECASWARRAGTYYLRVPAWAPRDKVRAPSSRRRKRRSSGAALPTNYVVAGPIYPGDTLELAYPVAEFWQENDVQLEGHAPQKVSYHWVGNTVVEAKPEAEFIPLYPCRG